MIALLTSLALAADPVPPVEAPPPLEAPAPPVEAPAPPVEAPVPPVEPPVAPVPRVNPWAGADTSGNPFDPGVRRERPADVAELSIELGSLAADDERREVFSNSDQIGSWGLRAGFRPISRLVVFGDWQRSRTGLTIEGDTDAGTSLGTHQVSLGGRADVPLLDGVLLPYAGVAALGVFGTARFDDDTTDPESAGQVAYSGFAPGALAVGGAEVRVVPADRIAVALHLELGYAAIGALPLGAFGAYDIGGFVMRTGIGIRI